MASALEIQARSRRYANLRAAQRTLGEMLHPGELQRALEQGRSIRGRLQVLSARGDEAPDPAGLSRVDQLLDRLSADTLSMLLRVGFNEGRHRFRRLASEEPKLVRVLAEVVLEADLESDPNLRMLEFLVTLLSCEQSGAKKVVARSPFEALPALEACYDALREQIEPGAEDAERRLLEATATIAQQSDVGESRDRMRQFKRELGVGMLHPRVFAALVAYNAAVSNRVEELIGDGRLLEALEQDLELGPADSIDPSDSLFDSEGFGRLLTALAHHLAGESCSDAAAMRLAARCDPADLTAGEIEAFTAPEEESNARLARAAVALGLVLPQLDQCAVALTELGIDGTRVSGPWPAELWRTMTAAAQDLLADGRYAEAQRLAAVRGRNLGEHRASFSQAPDARRHPPRIAPIRPGAIPVSSPLLQRTAAGIALFIGLLALAFWQWPSHDRMEAPELASLSPHLVAAYESRDDGVRRLVGRVGATWQTLADADRQQAIDDLGGRLLALGIHDVILVDDRNYIQGRYENGEILWFAPRPRRLRDAVPAP